MSNDMETKKDYVNRIYQEACRRGLCRRRKEFAKLVGMDASTISSALSGNEKYLTDNFVRRLQAWEAQALSDNEPQQEEQRGSEGGVFIPSETAALYNNMAETIRIQAELIARLQGAGVASPAPFYAPKNRVEGSK